MTTQGDETPILRFTPSGDSQFHSPIDAHLSCAIDLVGSNRWRWTISSAHDTLGEGVAEGPWQSAAGQAQTYLNAAYPMATGR